MGILKTLLGSTAAGARDDSGSKYRCVQIIVDRKRCCRPARELVGRRFLPGEIPELPLPDCDRPECPCGYELLNDRRDRERRS